ncbi:MAG: hypothetical protein ACQGVK_04295 [Myxococcota bacterium]
MPPRTDDHPETGLSAAASRRRSDASTGAAVHGPTPAGVGRPRRIESTAGQLSRVGALLERAEDPTLPTERRLRLLALSSRCLDTVFEAADTGAPDGASDRAFDDSELRSLVARQEKLLFERLLPERVGDGIELCSWDGLTDAQRSALVPVFDERIFPVLTPLRVGPAHPSPRLASLVLQIGVLASDGDDGEQFFARVELPDFLPRFSEVPGAAKRFVALEELVAALAGRLFPGATIESAGAFRVTRSHRSAAPGAGVGAPGPLPPRGAAVRLECTPGLDAVARRLLLRALGLGEDALYLRPSPIDLGSLDALGVAPAQGLSGRRESPTLSPSWAPSPVRLPRSPSGRSS